MGDGIIVIFFWTGEIIGDFRGEIGGSGGLKVDFFYHKGARRRFTKVHEALMFFVGTACSLGLKKKH